MNEVSNDSTSKNPVLDGINALSLIKDHITAASIKSLIPTKCDEFKSKIIEETSASRLNRSFLGINIQFLKMGKIEIRTLAVRELKERNTGVYLKRV